MNWKPIAGGAVIAVVAFVAGRMTAPEKPARVEVREVVRLEEVAKVVEKIVAQERVRVVRDEVRVIHRDEAITLAADGTVTQTRRETERTGSHASEQAERVRTEYVDRVVEKRVDIERLRTVELRPRWMLSGGPVLPVGDWRPDGGQVAAHVRIAGGLWAGAGVVVRDGEVSVAPSVAVTW